MLVHGMIPYPCMHGLIRTFSPSTNRTIQCLQLGAALRHTQRQRRRDHSDFGDAEWRRIYRADCGRGCRSPSRQLAYGGRRSRWIIVAEAGLITQTRELLTELLAESTRGQVRPGHIALVLTACLSAVGRLSPMFPERRLMFRWPALPAA